MSMAIQSHQFVTDTMPGPMQDEITRFFDAVWLGSDAETAFERTVRKFNVAESAWPDLRYILGLYEPGCEPDDHGVDEYADLDEFCRSSSAYRIPEDERQILDRYSQQYEDEEEAKKAISQALSGLAGSGNHEQMFADHMDEQNTAREMDAWERKDDHGMDVPWPIRLTPGHRTARGDRFYWEKQIESRVADKLMAKEEAEQYLASMDEWDFSPATQGMIQALFTLDHRVYASLESSEAEHIRNVHLLAIYLWGEIAEAWNALDEQQREFLEETVGPATLELLAIVDGGETRQRVDTLGSASLYRIYPWLDCYDYELDQMVDLAFANGSDPYDPVDEYDVAQEYHDLFSHQLLDQVRAEEGNKASPYEPKIRSLAFYQAYVEAREEGHGPERCLLEGSLAYVRSLGFQGGVQDFIRLVKPDYVVNGKIDRWKFKQHVNRCVFAWKPAKDAWIEWVATQRPLDQKWNSQRARARACRYAYTSGDRNLVDRYEAWIRSGKWTRYRPQTRRLGISIPCGWTQRGVEAALVRELKNRGLSVMDDITWHGASSKVQTAAERFGHRFVISRREEMFSQTTKPAQETHVPEPVMPSMPAEAPSQQPEYIPVPV